MANQAEPMAMGGAFVEDVEAQARFIAHKRYLAWRRRVLPVAAVLLFLVVWWQAVEIFDIKPFIAPSPIAVAEVLVQRFDMLMSNLLPTAIEAVLGFLLGNFAAISLATVFVWRKTAEEALFPIAVMVNTIPVVAKAPILVLRGFIPQAIEDNTAPIEGAEPPTGPVGRRGSCPTSTRR